MSEMIEICEVKKILEPYIKNIMTEIDMSSVSDRVYRRLYFCLCIQAIRFMDEHMVTELWNQPVHKNMTLKQVFFSSEQELSFKDRSAILKRLNDIAIERIRNRQK